MPPYNHIVRSSSWEGPRNWAQPETLQWGDHRKGLSGQEGCLSCL